jgi:hypothetical protein
MMKKTKCKLDLKEKKLQVPHNCGNGRRNEFDIFRFKKAFLF